jgi:hypothetical protein
VATEAQ